MNLKYFLFWLPMIPIAIFNGIIREGILNIHFNQIVAHQISTLLLILLCTIYIRLIFRFLKLNSIRQALKLGLLWVLLTVLFEFGLGLALGHSWNRLWSNYNLLTGQIWLIFLISLFLLPYLFYKVKSLKSD